MRWLSALILLTLVALAQGPPAREILSLDGTWNFTVTGSASNREVQVPSGFEDHEELSFNGAGTYTRTLPRLATDAGSRWLLECDAAATECSVRVNGRELARHVGPWTRFRCDITEALHGRAEVADELSLEVREITGHATDGFLPVVAPHFGGLWQSVRLLHVPSRWIDDANLLVSADAARSEIELRVPLRGQDIALGDQLRVRVIDPDGTLVAEEACLVSENCDPESRVLLRVPLERPRLWSADSPVLYGVEILFQPMHGRGDIVRTRCGFRTSSTSGSRFLWNGRPVSLRGVLHWGYAPPSNRPSLSEAHIRAEIAAARAMGANMIKFCLWLPPRRFLELCDELGMYAWVEYPTWHAPWDAAHAAALGAEYTEFFAHDRNHPCVALRSLTCETGPGADLAVMRGIFEKCKSMIPGALVEDDSSWIQWNRIHDFWDDHPYGNNHTWVRELTRLKDHISAAGVQPLALGEAIAADTWPDTTLLARLRAADAAWPVLEAFPAISALEDGLSLQDAQTSLDRLRPDSLRSAMLMRKFQIEAYRREVPAGAYVLSVLRDFPKASMGLLDSAGDMKWPATDWAFHGDTMLLLRTPNDARSLAAGECRAEVMLSHFGRAPLRQLSFEARLNGVLIQKQELREQRAGALTRIGTLNLSVPSVRQPELLQLELRLFEGSAQRARNTWDLWAMPSADSGAAMAAARHQSATDELLPLGITPRWDGKAIDRVIVAEHCDAPLLDALARGANVLLLPDGSRTAPKIADHWFLRGGPLLPQHPLSAAWPRNFIVDLQHFDLAARVMPAPTWLSATDPALLLWDAHDRSDVQLHALIAETRVGAGRLLVSALNHRGDNPAGAWLLTEMLSHLAHGPAPRAMLPPEALQDMRRRCGLAEFDLTGPGWKFAPVTLAATSDKSEAAASFDDSAWTEIRVGSAWEGQGFPALDGHAWYRRNITLPTEFAGREVWLQIEGADDSYEVFMDGLLVGRGGDPATRTTAFSTPQSLRLPVQAGTPFTLAIRVLDWQGAGGLHRPLRIATAPLPTAQALF
ncbi:MAG: hypothetical protein EXS14_07700 [Planctomycetes bacterium]|nr:hypothetical protein [Planctomycetota bacterium]